MTAAASAVAVIAEIGMWSLIPFVVIGMTGSAVRRVGREGPRDALAVAGMTVVTSQIGPVISWVVTHMHVIGYRQPAVGAVAHVALLSGNEMPARHTGCGGAIVAAVTSTEHL